MQETLPRSAGTFQALCAEIRQLIREDFFTHLSPSQQNRDALPLLEKKLQEFHDTNLYGLDQIITHPLEYKFMMGWEISALYCKMVETKRRNINQFLSDAIFYCVAHSASLSKSCTFLSRLVEIISTRTSIATLGFGDGLPKENSSRKEAELIALTKLLIYPYIRNEELSFGSFFTRGFTRKEKITASLQAAGILELLDRPVASLPQEILAKVALTERELAALQQGRLSECTKPFINQISRYNDDIKQNILQSPDHSSEDFSLTPFKVCKQN